MRGLTVLNWEDGLNALGLEGIEAIVFRTVGDQPSLWESILPEEVRRLPDELARVDALQDDPAFADGDLSAVDVLEVSLSAGV
jgi:IS5 family transposase